MYNIYILYQGSLVSVAKLNQSANQSSLQLDHRGSTHAASQAHGGDAQPALRWDAIWGYPIFGDLGMSENVGYIPNEIAI